MLGEKAAIAANAKRHNSKFSAIEKNHITFHGCGVPDLVYYSGKDVEMKEAKGGTSQLGERWDVPKKKRVKQCSMAYNRTIAKLLTKSNYKGRHPTVGCGVHKGAPVNNCKGCKGEERKHRIIVGKKLTIAIAKKKPFKKAVIRGGYTKTCQKAPKVEKAYDGSGNAIAAW